MKNLNKQKRLTLELISDNLNTQHNLNTSVSLVDYSIKDFTNRKVYIRTKKGLELTNMKSLKSTESLDLLFKYLELILKGDV
ncbi:hypothetical protein SAC_82 [Staphylococcus phage SAC]|nr:hypothetical protein SAC_82 [Staphylococcus phage SAC]